MQDYSSYSEKKLLHLISAGDESAFRQVYDQYRKRIYSYALNLTEDEDKAGDVVQEVFLKVWLNRDKLPNVSNFNAWIHAIARNYFFDAIKKLVKESAFLKNLTAAVDDSTNETENFILNKENEFLLQQAVEKLPPQQKLIFELRGQGLKQDEIAEKLNISKNTVKAHLARALSSIKNYLSNHTDASLTILIILLSIGE